jgi:uncharacterized protein YbjT (DUF2867 family)
MTMRIVIAGGHGQIALRLERLLAARGYEVAGIIRKPEQAEDLRSAGAEAVVLDLESTSADELAEVLGGADAVVFAAGAGPGSTAERKETMDRDGAVLLAEAAEQAGVRRYVIVSSRSADSRRQGDDVGDVYWRAKGAADDAVRARSALDWTVLRPGELTNDEGTGLVELAEKTERGSVPRQDVAAVIAELLRAPGTVGRTLELIGGTTSVADAVRSVARSQ